MNREWHGRQTYWKVAVIDDRGREYELYGMHGRKREAVRQAERYAEVAASRGRSVTWRLRPVVIPAGYCYTMTMEL